MNEERWRLDHQFEDRKLEKVVRSGNGYELHQENSWVLGIDDPGWEPRAGDTARFFGEGIGRPIRGVVVFPKRGGMPLVAYYRTAQEQSDREDRWVGEQRAKRRAEADANRVENEAKIAALPDVFRQRIERFRAANDDFEAEYQPYELFCCEEAVKIAAALKSRPDDVRAFGQLSWAQQKQIVPTLSDGHSGNTFGMAVRLAHWYLSQPQNVVAEHGALTPLVGCQQYGCTHETVTD